ncbi:MAG TPA: carboxypeptidase-like regulatory domain-containing protein, partial [Solirubrobacterales bacterium]|nr:carboxypeptidase-like regulatory domain-containing protein [Solirubrobacterales bacterium]
ASPADASDGYHLTGLREPEGTIWRADNSFVVEWDRNPAGSSSIVYWAVRGPDHEPLGTGVGTDTKNWGATTVEVPPVPGLYWFEALNVGEGAPFTLGGLGPPVSIPLLFDDAPPRSVSITAPAWVAAGTVVPIHLSHPAGPLPVSGIHGYAVSIDQAAAGSPCSRADRCAAGELDLAGGLDDDSTTLPAPPEGVSYVHASAVSGSGMRSTTATLAVGVDGTPPQVHLEGAPSGWAAGPVHLTVIAADPLSGMAPAGQGGPITAIGVDGGPPLLSPGAAAGATVSGQGVHHVVYSARDAVGNASDGSLPFAQPGTATVRIDETDPVVRFAAADPSDPERIEATVADALSGPDPTRGSIGLRRVGSAGRFQPLPTDVEGGRLVARWNSDDFPDGAYEFGATGYDAAGNSGSSLATGGAPLVLQNPVKRVTRVAFGFGGARGLVFPRCSRSDGARRCHRAVVHSFARRPATRAVPCCHGAVVGGRLADVAGQPLADQTVEVVEAFAGGARQKSRSTSVTTDADGYFQARLAPGPSRSVSVEFDGTRRLTRAAGRSLRLRVRAAVHLRVSTARVRVGGAPVVFSGQIVHPETRIPTRGLPVELEFRLPGTAWAEFRTVQSDAYGRFAYPYSFSDDDSAGIRFLFRAFVPATGDWPFAPATSRPLAVTG